MQYQRLSKRQLLAMTWWARPATRDKDALICDGSIRSGKTLCIAVGFLLWSMSRFDGQVFGICGKTIESLRRNVISQLADWVDGVLDVTEKRSENKLIVTQDGRSNTYYLFGGRDESSYTLVQGITLAGALLDEVALMPRSFVEQVLARCSVDGSKFWFNCNPAGPNHWFYQEWVKKLPAHNALRLHFTMDDNLALAPRIKARYESMYSGVFYERYILGLWRVADGIVYDCFDKERHMTAKALETAGSCYVSVDYGTQNPTVFLLWQRERGSERWVCRKEYYWSGREKRRQKTDGDYADDMAAFLAGETPRAIIVDPSAASFIAELRRRGWPIQKADNAVLDGIRAVAQRLKSDELLFSAQCVHCADEFHNYVWDDKAAQRGEDKPVKEHDHCMDAIRYFVSTVLERGEVRVGHRPRGL